MSSCSPFQQATVQAICRHFETSNSALCADEAGLGKTFVARGVIGLLAQRHALKQCGERVIQDKIKQWWRQFGASVRGNSHAKERLPAFAKSVGLDEESVKGRGRIAGEARIASQVLDRLETLSGEELEQFCLALTMNLPYLLIQRGNRRRTAWDFSAWEDYPVEPLRVLYVCCNLAIAEQNTRKLVDLPQRSIRSGADKADRLSILWHYLKKYPTPYIEIYPITATVSAMETPGTKNEAALLGAEIGRTGEAVRADSALFRRLRQKGEERSLQELKPDLVIFDEFQNFGTIISMVRCDSDQMDKMSAQLEGQIVTLRQKGGNTERIAQLESQKDSLERIFRTCRALYAGEHTPKTLMLSATPFHTVEESGEEECWSRLDLKKILTFLGGEGVWEQFLQCDMPGQERILYETCGIFRTERQRLLPQHRAVSHEIEVEGAGLLSAAAKLCASGQGNRGHALVKTTPDADEVGAHGLGRYGVFLREEQQELTLQPHPRALALENVVCAADDTGRRGEVERLLWLPPLKPSRPLDGVFANFGDYSKTLVYSSLKATPVQVCAVLNRNVPTLSLDWSQGEREWLEEQLHRLSLPGGTPVGALADYLRDHGGCAFQTVEEAVRYCQDGCLEDVLKEYFQLCRENKTDYEGQLQNALDCCGSFAAVMDDAALRQGGLRSAFNAPFRPFVLMTTSIGAEGLDFHLYCRRLAHYTLPNSVVQWEQKNGRIDRRNSLAVRRNWARRDPDPAAQEKSGGMSPHWDAGSDGLHHYYFLIRHTDERTQYERLKSELRRYRATLGIADGETEGGFDFSPFSRRG